jgi:WD40 repeat protein
VLASGSPDSLMANEDGSSIAKCSEWACSKSRPCTMHGEHVKVLVFSASSKLLACCGLRHVRVWNIVSGEVFAIRTTAQVLALTFMENDRTLMGAAKDNHLLTWDLQSGKPHARIHWHESMGNETSNLSRAPTVASFSPELKLMGVVCRGQPVMIWDLENDSVLSYCGKPTKARLGRRAVNTAVVDLVFTPLPHVNRLATAYQDGDSILFDPLEGNIIETVVAEAQNLACSPYGQTLATGTISGTIQLYDFETLRLMYRINSWGHGINSLAFSSDSLQFVDIRGSQCNVWEPSILVRQSTDEEHSDSDTIYSSMKEISSSMIEELVSITTIVAHPTLDFVFCGRDDGSVGMYEALSGKLRKELYRHIEGIAVTSLSFESGCVVSVDSSSQILGYKVSGNARQLQCQRPTFDFHLEQAITHVLPSPSLTSIFVSFLDADPVYTTEGEILRSIPRTGDSRRWCVHRRDPSKLVSVTNKVVRFYTWDDLGPETATLDHALKIEFSKSFRVDAVIQHPGSDHIAVRFADVRGNRSSARTTLVDISALDEEPTQSRVTHSQSNHGRHEALEAIIEHFIGYIGMRVIFLDRNGWICSADLGIFVEDFYLRHFFIPSDWLSINLDLVCLLTAKE